MRYWSNRKEDDGSIHAIGNGSLLIYQQGPDIINVYGPPYSAPSSFCMTVEEPQREVNTASEREVGTAVWTHILSSAGGQLGKFTDYISPWENKFIREWELEEPVQLKLRPTGGARLGILPGYFSYTGFSGTCFHLTVPKGTGFFATSEPLLVEVNLLIVFTGNTETQVQGDGSVHIQLMAGSGRMLLSASTRYPEAVAGMEKALQQLQYPWLEEVRAYWNEFSGRRKDFSNRIPMHHPMRQRMLDAIDSVSVLIKCQQSASGGVAAGHYYNMAYVRDQAGVVRGLLALGYLEEAKAILDFWFAKWSLFENLCNAEGMENDAARLFFTNDEVEIPAYLILNSFQYYEKTGDEAYLRKLLPMLEWALSTQTGHLIEGMTEFSGDETYIAGGTFPHLNMYQGSAESTLLFITTGEKLLDWVEQNAIWDTAKIAKYRNKVWDAKSRFKENFMYEGKLYANNPIREAIAGKPRFRYSFCESHIRRIEFRLTWTERNDQGYYLCSECRNEHMPDPQMDGGKRYLLNSVNLVPIYIGSSLFSEQEQLKILQPGIDVFAQTGRVPSNLEGTRSLGYDYGLMLYNLVKLHHPMQDRVLEKMLDLLDPTGAWVEYYDGDKPANCRARPWESGINIEAVVEYIEQL